MDYSFIDQCSIGSAWGFVATLIFQSVLVGGVCFSGRSRISAGWTKVFQDSVVAAVIFLVILMIATILQEKGHRAATRAPL